MEVNGPARGRRQQCSNALPARFAIPSDPVPACGETVAPRACRDAASMRGMNPATIHVACLCAAWCRTCEAYEHVLEAIAREPMHDAALLRWHWIDVEEEADLVGDYDVETFPTLVIADAEQVRFAGPLTPQPETLRRLLRATVADAASGSRWPDVAPEIASFAERLRARPVRD